MPIGDVQSQRTDAGMFVVKKTGERPAGKRSLEDVRSEIENLLFAEESQRLYNEWVSRFRKNAKIEIFDVF